MKKLFLFLTVTILALGSFNGLAATLTETLETPGETWKVITPADSNQMITLHLHQKLVVRIDQLDQWGQYSFTTGDQNMLQAEFYGSLKKSVENDSYLWIFQPLATGETTLTFTKSYLFFSEKYAEFIITIVE